MRTKHLKVFLILITTLLCLTLTTDVALAQTEQPEETEYVELTGEVLSFDAETGTVLLAVENEEGETVEYTVQLSEDYDFESLEEGETITVVGSFNEEGDFVSEASTDDTEEDQDGNGMNYFCANPDAVHPVAEGIAEKYDVSYQEVMGWFCKSDSDTEEDGEGEEGESTEEEETGNNAATGFGQIMLALQTADATEDAEDSADTYLEMRAQGQGWGQIWQELGHKGKPKSEEGEDTDEDGEGEEGEEMDAEAEEDEDDGDETGPPDDVGPPDDAGPPDHAGPKDKEDQKGPPDHAGPKDKGGKGKGGKGKGKGK